MFEARNSVRFDAVLDKHVTQSITIAGDILCICALCLGLCLTWGCPMSAVPASLLAPYPAPGLHPEMQKQLLPEQTLLSRVNAALLNGTMNAQQEGGTKKAPRNKNSPSWHAVPANF